jgi:hypothetical protein
MNFSSMRRGRLALALAITILVGATGAMITAPTDATKVATTTLGPAWDCWQVAWITSCTQARATAIPPKHDIVSALPKA